MAPRSDLLISTEKSPRSPRAIWYTTGEGIIAGEDEDFMC